MSYNFLDENGLLYFWQKIKTIFATQSDLEDLEQTVEGIVSTGGEANVIDTVKVNNSALTPDANKAVNITIAQGDANGTIAVNGSDVAVKGLGSAAYTASTAYDASGAAAAVLGSSTDSASANTVYGAKAAASAAQSDVDALESLVGSTAVSTQITNAINGLDSSVAAETNKAIASVTITNGKISASTKATIPTNNNQLTNGAGYQTASDVSSAISASGYQANVIETIKVNGTAQSVTAKAVDITVPTNNNQLTNGAGYQTSSQVQSAISTAIAGVTQFDFQVVSSLPATGVKGTIYLVPNSGSGTNTKDEYIYVNNGWEKIGTTDVDLSGYVPSSDLVAITNSEIDTVVAS